MTREDPVGAELVGLRIFAGLTLAEAAEVLGIGSRTADRYWAYARAWLCDALSGDTDPTLRFQKIPNPPGAVEGETEH
jgi:hypothetical protein